MTSVNRCSRVLDSMSPIVPQTTRSAPALRAMRIASARDRRPSCATRICCSIAGLARMRVKFASGGAMRLARSSRHAAATSRPSIALPGVVKNGTMATRVNAWSCARSASRAASR